MTFLDKVFVCSLLAGAIIIFMMFAASFAGRMPRIPKLRMLKGAGRLIPRRGPKVKLGLNRSRGRRLPPGTSSVLLGLFLVIFGGPGLTLDRAIGAGPFLSLIASALIAIVSTFSMAVFLWRYFIAGQLSSEMQSRTLTGTVGRISVAIPENGVGQVAYVNDGKRVTLPARGHNGLAIGKSTQVMIREMAGNTAIVEEFRLLWKGER